MNSTINILKYLEESINKPTCPSMACLIFRISFCRNVEAVDSIIDVSQLGAVLNVNLFGLNTILGCVGNAEVEVKHTRELRKMNKML